MSELQSDDPRDHAAEIQIPLTPQPNHTTLGETVSIAKARFESPATRSTSDDMTPPPSSQVLEPRSPPVAPRRSSHSNQFPASPPATVKVNAGPTAANTIPTADEIANAGEQELRNMVTDLVGALREASMSSAHFKLQHSLLAMESFESLQRAEVEHQMTKREVEVLQAETHGRPRSTQTPQAQLPSPQSATDPAVARYRELELENVVLERRLRKAKQLIEEERERALYFQDETIMLKRRIQENREHYNRLKRNGYYESPRNEFMTPQRPAHSQIPGTSDTQNTDQIAALLAADQIINGEPISVPSTPTKLPSSKIKHGHLRGAHSMSSLQSTPTRSQPTSVNRTAALASSNLFSSAVNSQTTEPQRHDRDSTISVSDDAEERDDEAVTDEELPQSQASSLATNMLRRNPGLSQEAPAGTSASAERQSNRLQATLFGSVKKAGIDRSEFSNSGKTNGKRPASFGEADLVAKKQKMKTKGGEAVGLGIGNWGSPRK